MAEQSLTLFLPTDARLADVFFVTALLARGLGVARTTTHAADEEEKEKECFHAVCYYSLGYFGAGFERREDKMVRTHEFIDRPVNAQFADLKFGEQTGERDGRAIGHLPYLFRD